MAGQNTRGPCWRRSGRWGIALAFLGATACDTTPSDPAPAEPDTLAALGFDLTLRWVGAAPWPEVEAAFLAARKRVEWIIVADLDAQRLIGVHGHECAPGSGTVSETIDDVLIFARIEAIDGVGGVTGQAWPCALRASHPHLPYLGFIEIDAADVLRLLDDGSLVDVILHELLHTLGFGANWERNALLQGSGTSTPTFIGGAARAAYTLAGGTNTEGIPVANVGAAGTRDAHWREQSLGSELMTPVHHPGVLNALSAITIGSLADLGYTVSYSAADPFVVPATPQMRNPSRGQRAP